MAQKVIPTLEYHIPSEDEPGYLQRWEKRVAYLKAIQNPDADPGDVWDAVWGYLGAYITKPADTEKAKKALQEQSRAFIRKMVDDISAEWEADPNS